MGTGGWIFLGLIVLLVVWIVATYNGLVGGRNQVKNAGCESSGQTDRVRAKRDAKPSASAREALA